MKYAILFLLVLAVPVTSAYAIKSPFVKYNGSNVDEVIPNKNPFTTRQTKIIGKKLSQKQKAQNSNYNGDEDGAEPLKKKKRHNARQERSSSGQQNFKGRQSAQTYQE